MPRSRRDIARLARDRLGHESLRPGQEEAVGAVLERRDTLAVLPTGAGKSAIYQLAGLLLEGPTVVVSPLLALQRDQVGALDQTGDDGLRGVAVNSTVKAAAVDDAFTAAGAGDVEFLFLGPEQLAKPDVVERLRSIGPALFVVDEAHCISGWGHDFRPDYLGLGAVADALGRPTILALTATAAPPVRAEIVERLGMVHPAVVVRGFDRPNLHLGVELHADASAKDQAIVDAVRSAAVGGPATSPGIVYAATRRRTEDLTAAMTATGLRAAAYHAGLPTKERGAVHDAFTDDRLDVVVATTAFGMGIDKPNVRFVFHADVSESVDSYYQEIGRAGRDGEPARAVLFFRSEDVGVRRFFVSGGGVGYDHLARVAVLVMADGGNVDVERIVADTGLSKSKLTAAVSQLRSCGLDEPDADPLEVARRAAEAEEARQRVDRSRVDMIRGYAEARGCRRSYLLSYFGEPADPFCGHCDTCDHQAAEGAAANRGGAGAAGDGTDGDVIDLDDMPLSAVVAVDTRVRHAEWGEGLLVRAEGDTLTVLFDDVGYKNLSLRLVTDAGLLEPVA